jgi:hypothetical protein
MRRLHYNDLKYLSFAKANLTGSNVCYAPLYASTDAALLRTKKPLLPIQRKQGFQFVD